jgi:hypothetical protein
MVFRIPVAVQFLLLIFQSEVECTTNVKILFKHFMAQLDKNAIFFLDGPGFKLM